ncbi:AMP-binding protein [Effusibacillus dendaii]|uniref:AMP-binding protein n=1 Tax=Effusibacillus dendaii TaxID=2743772 RepID=UPI00190C821F|nr:AMP-binding protein [Effusibacillus dendaii]
MPESVTVVVHDPQLTDHDFQPELADSKLDQQFAEVSFEQVKKGKSDNLSVELNFGDTANIIYTSGTTGPSKGVAQPFRWINGYTFKRKLLNREDVIYNDLPLYHVGGAFFNIAREAFVGCSVAAWDKFSLHHFGDRIHKSGSPVATLLDVMIPWLLKAEKPDDRRNSLNKVHMQPLPEYHYQVAKRFGIDFVTVGFGQTESGAGFSGLIHELDETEGTPDDLYKGYSRREIMEIASNYGMPVRDGKTDFKKGYMGAPSSLVEAAILNEKDEPCKIGEVGQIAISPEALGGRKAFD